MKFTVNGSGVLGLVVVRGSEICYNYMVLHKMGVNFATSGFAHYERRSFFE
jgi:hypothetical protein